MPSVDLLRDYLRQIQEKDAQFGGKLQPAASENDLVLLSQQMNAQFSYFLPTAYLALLSVADGMDFNGYTLYASKTQPVQGEEKVLLQGIREANEFWQEYEKNTDHHLIMFGETGDDLYLFDKRRGKFQITDKVSGSFYEEFATFEELSERLFKSALDILES